MGGLQKTKPGCTPPTHKSKNGNDKTLDDFLCDGSDQHAVDYTRWVVEECKPLDTCESKAFNRMMTGVKKGYKPLDRHTVTGKIGSITSFVVTILVLMVLGQFLAITSDHWSSLSDQSFLAITGTIYFIFLRFLFLFARFSYTSAFL